MYMYSTAQMQLLKYSTAQMQSVCITHPHIYLHMQTRLLPHANTVAVLCDRIRCLCKRFCSLRNALCMGNPFARDRRGGGVRIPQKLGGPGRRAPWASKWVWMSTIPGARERPSASIVSGCGGRSRTVVHGHLPGHLRG